MRFICVAAMLMMMMMMAVGCAPDDIAYASCKEPSFFVTADPWSCTVKAAVVGQASNLEFKTESRNQIARVNIVLRVTKGTLRVVYYDLTGEQRLMVTPSEPANLDMQTRLDRERRSFTLMVEPVNGRVEGLDGTVKYSTP